MLLRFHLLRIHIPTGRRRIGWGWVERRIRERWRLWRADNACMRHSLARRSRSHAVRDRMRFAIACGAQSRAASARKRSRSHAGRGRVRPRKRACGQLGHGDVGRDVVDKRELARHLDPPALERHDVKACAGCVRARRCQPGTRRERRAYRGGRHSRSMGGRGSSRRAAHTHRDARKPRAYSPIQHKMKSRVCGLPAWMGRSVRSSA